MINKVEITNVNTSKLPVLSNEEKAELFIKIKQGDKKAREKFINGNLKLVLSVIKKFNNRGENVDDLFQVGCIGLIKAINTFNIEKNIKLATYASRCIENEILMYLRRSSKTKNEVSFDEPLNTDGDGNELLLADILGTEEDIVFKDLENETDKKIVKEYICKLNSRERDIMNLRFGFNTGEEKTQKEVADMLGISQSYISRIEKKIIHKMKKEILAKL